MYSQQETRARLENEAQNILFEAEFQKEVDRLIAEKQANKNKTLAEKLKVEHRSPLQNQRFSIEGDDEMQSEMWKSFLKDCAYYYDVPTIDDENKMRRTLQYKYDSILPAGWRAPLTSRRDLLTWACNRANNKLIELGEVKEGEPGLPCDNFNALLKVFGPDYSRIRPKLGYVKGLFD